MIGNLLKGNVSASSLQEDVYLLRCVCQEIPIKEETLCGSRYHNSVPSLIQ